MQTDDPASHANLYIHVRILLGMIVGLGLTHLLRHVARIVERPRAHRIYGVHLVWAGFMFVYMLHFWWWEFSLSHQAHWSFMFYLYVTLYALLLYLLMQQSMAGKGAAAMLLIMAITVIPVAGLIEQSLAIAIAQMMGLGILIGTLVNRLAHALFPPLPVAGAAARVSGLGLVRSSRFRSRSRR